MSGWTLFLILFSQVALVTGQITIKRAMNFTHLAPKPWAKIIGTFAAGLALLTLCFFLWLGFLQKLQLSRVFPFEGLSPALLVIGASVFLKEHIGARGWAGIALISAGIVLVSLS